MEARRPTDSSVVVAMGLLTAVTGLVDATSYLGLGHVFTANMTGNVVFLGFALGGAPGFSVPTSLVALGAFVLGAVLGGRLLPSGAAERRSLVTLARSSRSCWPAASSSPW